jgi:hypothetical protein
VFGTFVRHRSWQAAAVAVAAGAVILLSSCEEAEEPTPARGGTYSLQLNLSNFTPHVSQKMEARVVDLGSEAEVGRVSATGNTTVIFFFGQVLTPGRSYRVDFYADLDRSETYTPPVGDPPTSFPDHQWRITSTSDFAEGAAGLANASRDVVLSMLHNAKWTDVDWPGAEKNIGVDSRYLRLTLKNFAPHANQRVEARVVDEDGQKEVARQSAIGKPDMTLNFGHVLVSGRSYRVDLYADLDGNGEHTPPIGDPPVSFPDHQWRIDSKSDFAEGAAGLAGVLQSVTLVMSHNTKWTDVDWPTYEKNTALHRLTLELTAFAPHAGQRIEGRVIELASGKEVARKDVVGAVDVALDFGPVLVAGRTYRLDFYADLDKDGAYTPPKGDPPTGWPDHQWRITSASQFAAGAAGLARVAGDVTLTMRHNTTWTDIDWPGAEANA